jgi:hypothetical protein
MILASRSLIIEGMKKIIHPMLGNDRKKTADSMACLDNSKKKNNALEY